MRDRLRFWRGARGAEFVVVLGVAGSIAMLLAGPVRVAAQPQDLPPPAARVQRQADNPMRWILEAGKLKARVRPPEAAASAAARPTVAARPAMRTTTTTATAAPARNAPPPKPAAPAAASLARDTPPGATPDGASPAADPPAPPAADPPATAGRGAPAEPLELVDGDEPSLPESVDAALEADAVLELAIVVLADGTVGNVSVVSSSHPMVDEHAIAAVRGWRFKPVAQSQMRIVELVFHPRR